MHTSNIKYIAVDDDLIDLIAINTFASAYPRLHACGSYDNANDALTGIQTYEPDIAFLDIDMPGFSGIDLLKKIRTIVPIGVFITSHPEFAMDGFEVSAIDFILKPLTVERFSICIRRIEEYFEMLQKAKAYEVLVENDTLTIQEGYNKIKLSQNEIIYLEAMQDYTKIVTDDKKYMTNVPLSGFMSRVPENKFMRVHRSYAVSLQRIKEIRQNEVVCGGKVIPIGKTYRSIISKLTS